MNTEPPPTYIRLDVVRQQVPLSKSGIYEMIANRQFPPPHRLGARAVGWLQSEVTEWVVARTKEPPAVAKAPRPKALKREERLAKQATTEQRKK